MCYMQVLSDLNQNANNDWDDFFFQDLKMFLEFLSNLPSPFKCMPTKHNLLPPPELSKFSACYSSAASTLDTFTF